ncbi:phage shock protein PspA [Alteromonas facilis]|uniref:phage shock protein PspA n=1 Tax=Alteromonas facilis TaxID=2048004 RepID=UPI000C289113|nr:phage shock protein PspA [Alteromonas facilis]
MGMFSRISDIVQSNINAMLDKAEDPEKVIRLIIQEMEETLVEIRSVAAKNLADQKMLDRKIAETESRALQWQKKAELAVEKARDDLARAALTEKHNAEKAAEELHHQKAQLEELITNIQEDTARLQNKLSEARTKQKSLVSRKQNSVVRLQAKSTVNSDAINKAMARFDHYETRVETLEAQVDAFDIVPSSTQLAQDFAALEKDETVENELAKLKAKLAKAEAPAAAKKSTSKSSKKAA